MPHPCRRAAGARAGVVPEGASRCRTPVPIPVSEPVPLCQRPAAASHPASHPGVGLRRRFEVAIRR